MIFASFLIFPSAAFANPVPDQPSSPWSSVQSISLNCDETWLTVNQSRLRYRFANLPAEEFYETEVDTDYPEGSYCGWFIAQMGGQNTDSGSDTGSQIEISQETLDWWQATIDVFKAGISIGAKVYPVILGIRVVSMIMYS